MSAHGGLERVIFLAVLAFAARGVSADDSSWHRIVDGMSVSLAVIAVELTSRPPCSLHGAELRRRDTDHVVIGQFDTAIERRISRAQVRAKPTGREPLGRETRLGPIWSET